MNMLMQQNSLNTNTIDSKKCTKGEISDYDSSTLYDNQVDARALIGQLAIIYCANKLMEKSRVF